ncbi:MAG: hypothetical protein DLM57_06805 [Pseudonocardiales bacterium]|nr:MAG: hypothetical protein DLM57_06805 [Pseudonocardiales bacterium]
MTLNHHPDVARRDPRRATPVLRLLTAASVVLWLVLAGMPTASADPATFQKMQWWLSPLQMRQVWQVTEGAGVTVAVLDTGVDPHVGDLVGAVLPGYDVTGKGGNGQQDYGAPLNPHGTDMATVIAGRGTGPGFRGMAPKAKILPVQMARSTVGSEPQDIVAATNLVAGLPHPPAIINISSGAPGACPADQQQAILRAISRGIIVVVSAGNDYNDGNASESPADCVGVVAVGAYDQNLAPWGDSQQQPYVALAAPGVKVPSPVPLHGQQTFDTGTSDAAAAVSGMLALLRARFPTMPARQLVARLFATTHHIGPGPAHNPDGSRNRNLVAGYGAALPYYALTAKVAADAPNPIYDAVAALQKVTPPAPSSSSSAGTRSNPAAGGTAPVGSNSTAGVLIVAGIAGATVIVVLIIIGLAVRSRRRSAIHTVPFAGGYGPPGPPPPPGQR